MNVRRTSTSHKSFRDNLDCQRGNYKPDIPARHLEFGMFLQGPDKTCLLHELWQPTIFSSTPSNRR